MIITGASANAATIGLRVATTANAAAATEASRSGNARGPASIAWYNSKNTGRHSPPVSAPCSRNSLASPFGSSGFVSRW